MLSPNLWLLIWLIDLDALLPVTEWLPLSVKLSYISNNFISAFATRSISFWLCAYKLTTISSFCWTTSFSEVTVPSFSAYCTYLSWIYFYISLSFFLSSCSSSSLETISFSCFYLVFSSSSYSFDFGSGLPASLSFFSFFIISFVWHPDSLYLISSV